MAPEPPTVSGPSVTSSAPANDDDAPPKVASPPKVADPAADRTLPSAASTTSAPPAKDAPLPTVSAPPGDATSPVRDSASNGWVPRSRTHWKASIVDTAGAAPEAQNWTGWSGEEGKSMRSTPSGTLAIHASACTVVATPGAGKSDASSARMLARATCVTTKLLSCRYAAFSASAEGGIDGSDTRKSGTRLQNDDATMHPPGVT